MELATATGSSVTLSKSISSSRRVFGGFFLSGGRCFPFREHPPAVTARPNQFGGTRCFAVAVAT
jgi:hypothetical protein